MAYALVGRLGCLLFLFSQGRYPVEMEGLAAGMVLTIGSATYSHLSQSISMVQTVGACTSSCKDTLLQIL